VSALLGALIVVFTLAITTAVECAVAALFRVGRRGVGAVALVNLVTNPALNVLIALFFTSLNQAGPSSPWWYFLAPEWLPYLLLPVLEVAVVMIEWRLLVWALRGTAGTSRKMLVLSVTMNVVSAVVATLASLLATYVVFFTLGGAG
jgi:hypothetical protein